MSTSCENGKRDGCPIDASAIASAPSLLSAAAIADDVVSSPARCCRRETKVVFLSVNDVYKLVPNDYGHGGIAELATLLTRARAKQPDDVTVVVTLNGDFLWRSDLDRKDKGRHMMDVVNRLGLDYVVVGNHEFDFGAPHLQELLAEARFPVLGSNVRDAQSGQLMRGLVDTTIVSLHHGLRLGLFGVCTTETAEDPFAGDQVHFEDEIVHARRCVSALQEQGADVIVALTHLPMARDQQLTRQVPGISLILGGHDHDVMTEFVSGTMIHKSGQDALWLAQIELTLHEDTHDGTPADTISSVEAEQPPASPVRVSYQWQMLCNHGYSADPELSGLLREYQDYVHADNEARGKLEPLITTSTPLDGTRASSRYGECNVGNLLTDALRSEFEADAAVIPAGLIKGDMWTPAGSTITPLWLELTLPHPKRSIVMRLSVEALKAGLECMLAKYPSCNSYMPQISGLQIVYDTSSRPAPFISSLRLTSSLDINGVPAELPVDREITVVLPQYADRRAWRERFAHGQVLRTGPILRDVVAQHLRRLGTHGHGHDHEIAYNPTDSRFCLHPAA